VIRAVGFDLDDTLLEHSLAVATAVTALVARHGWPSQPDDVGLWRNLERRHYPRYVAGELSFAAQRRERVGLFLSARGLDPGDFDLDDTFADYFTTYRDRWAPVTGATETIDHLHSMGRRVAVLTNGPRALQLAKLVALDLADRVDALLAVDDLPAGKPHPSAFLALARALDVVPDDLLYVGDDYEVDILGARQAGVRSAWLRRTWAEPAQDATTILSLHELPALIA
jgi:putative hydrolase of the HAD superfamily